MIVKLLTEHLLEFLSFKGGCRGSSESTLVKMPHCWKSHAAVQKRMIQNQDPGVYAQRIPIITCLKSSLVHMNEINPLKFHHIMLF